GSREHGGGGEQRRRVSRGAAAGEQDPHRHRPPLRRRRLRREVARARAAPGSVVAQLASRPSAASVASMLEPPYEMSGSGTPMTGIMPSTIPMLITAWVRIQIVMPAAR